MYIFLCSSNIFCAAYDVFFRATSHYMLLIGMLHVVYADAAMVDIHLTCGLALLSYMLVFIAVTTLLLRNYNLVLRSFFYHATLRVCFSFVLSVD